MKPLDLLAHFDSAVSAVAFIATYEFDPQFFERRLLATKCLSSADRIVIFVDRGRYQALIDAGLNVPGFNRRYLVIPISRAPYVFHPKLYLTVGPKRSDVIVGSSNCTNAGIGYNLELCSLFSVPIDKLSEVRDQAFLIRQVYELFKSFAEDAGPFKTMLAEEFFAAAEDHAPWLAKNVVLPRGEIELLHTQGRNLWGEVVQRLAGTVVRSIMVLSPFYDRDLGFLKDCRKQWPNAKLTVVAQPQYATLAGKLLSPLFSAGKHQLLAAIPQPGRNLHAKAFAFETQDGCYWLCGSANATKAAFQGQNTEASIWLKTKENAAGLLKESGLTLEKTDPTTFVSGTVQEPKNAEPRPALSLDSAVLREDGSLECFGLVPDGIRDLTLAVRNFNESLPFLSIIVRRRGDTNFSVDLNHSQIEQMRATALCSAKGVTRSGESMESNAVAVAQVRHVLREPHGGEGGASNSRKRIEETGENLVEYVDGLSDVREAIEFFSNISIRFQDGEVPVRGIPGGGWKPRDPFTPDTPPDWLNIPLGASEVELREAIVDFVERHQRDKLLRHVKRGNLNGLPNFLDIFRTLNSVLFAYNSRIMSGASAVIPPQFVTHHVMKNVAYMIGAFAPGEDADEDDKGYIASIYRNFGGDKALVGQRLVEEGVPHMLIAAVEAVIRVRANALNKKGLDPWAAERLSWAKSWIRAQGANQPTPHQIQIAAQEYAPGNRAA